MINRPVVLKYISGQLYANLPTWGSSDIAGFTGPKRSFMNPRRKHTVEAYGDGASHTHMCFFLLFLFLFFFKK